MDEIVNVHTHRMQYSIILPFHSRNIILSVLDLYIRFRVQNVCVCVFFAL